MTVNSGTAGTEISFSDLYNAYTGTHSNQEISLSDYYRGGGEVPSSTSTTTTTPPGNIMMTTPSNPGSFVVTLNSTLAYVRVTQGGMGNHTVVQNGTQIYSASQDDLPTATVGFRGPAYISGIDPHTSFTLASSGTVGFSGFRLPASIGRRTPGSTNTVTTQNNTNVPSSGTISLDTFNVPGTFAG